MTPKYILTVQDPDSDELLYSTEATVADSIIEGVRRAERYLKLRAEEAEGVMPDDEEPITEKEADRIEIESHTHA